MWYKKQLQPSLFEPALLSLHQWDPVLHCSHAGYKHTGDGVCCSLNCTWEDEYVLDRWNWVRLLFGLQENSDVCACVGRLLCALISCQTTSGGRGQQWKREGKTGKTKRCTCEWWSWPSTESWMEWHESLHGNRVKDGEERKKDSQGTGYCFVLPRTLATVCRRVQLNSSPHCQIILSWYSFNFEI